jgi:hypothetical protein
MVVLPPYTPPQHGLYGLHTAFIHSYRFVVLPQFPCHSWLLPSFCGLAIAVGPFPFPLPFIHYSNLRDGYLPFPSSCGS